MSTDEVWKLQPLVQRLLAIVRLDRLAVKPIKIQPTR
jgi:hypothetical protein